ncbi:helix-turn-helix domain-containing protein [Mesorhizobium sp. 131-2-1]|uniref:helix-turn-helix domain-containing protein n=1 Tax=Mesorhizobium sp. 131-2-1 TaxID=2744518 RepID=UPI0019296853|nr:helix-turn-helix domain-containing protein [Mesorhizobium sp. 131-2-1]
MAKPERKRLPWEKELVDLSKFDWQVAVNLSHDHKHSPLQLRVAVALMLHADSETMVAWPSQKTLAQYTGAASESQVRRAVVALCASTAITRGRISSLCEEDQAKVTRNKRGVAYRLNLLWAFETLEASQKPLPRMPKQLRDGLAAKAAKIKGTSDELDRSTVERNDRATVERYVPPYDRAAYQEGNIRDQIKEAPDRKDLASTRESQANAYSAMTRGT